MGHSDGAGNEVIILDHCPAYLRYALEANLLRVGERQDDLVCHRLADRLGHLHDLHVRIVDRLHAAKRRHDRARALAEDVGSEC